MELNTLRVQENPRPSTFLAPLYTSDYLLEKLPKYLEFHGKRADDCLLYLRPNFNTKKWTAYYHGIGEYMPFFIEADTPLKALLKLTIELHEAGELDPQDQTSNVAA